MAYDKTKSVFVSNWKLIILVSVLSCLSPYLLFGAVVASKQEDVACLGSAMEDAFQIIQKLATMTQASVSPQFHMLPLNSSVSLFIQLTERDFSPRNGECGQMASVVLPSSIQEEGLLSSGTIVPRLPAAATVALLHSSRGPGRLSKPLFLPCLQFSGRPPGKFTEDSVVRKQLQCPILFLNVFNAWDATCK